MLENLHFIRHAKCLNRYYLLFMDTLDKIATKIIKEQELIIGPLAWSEAKRVGGLTVVDQAGNVAIEGDKKNVIDALVARYDRLFGRASHEVSREAVLGLLADLAPGDVPMSLRG